MTSPAPGFRFLAAGNLLAAEPVMLVATDGAEAAWRLGVAEALAAGALLLGRPAPRLAEPPPAHPAARLALELQRLLGATLHHHGQDARAASFACLDQATGRAALAMARALLAGADAAGAAARLREAASPLLSSLAIAARRRGIPVSLAYRMSPPVLALGQGRKRRVFWRHFTPATPHIATVLTTTKDVTATLLRQAGLPVPRNQRARDLPAALKAAAELGFPLVVKPVAADFGRGVTTNIRTEAALRQAFARAREHGEAMVEQHIAGDHHRLLVMHGRCIAVSRRLPARVTGDGALSVAALVERVNATRTEHLSEAGVKIKLDAHALELLTEQGMTPASIPARGQVVTLRGNANQSSGGSVEMVTGIAHPGVLRMAEAAAALFGIDVAGIDYITTDITRSPRDSAGAICEVNITPGFVNQGEAVEMHGHFIAPFFPDDGRIATLCLLTPPAGAPELAAALRALLARGGQVAESDAAAIWTAEGNNPPPLTLAQRVAMALADPLADAALIGATAREMRAGGIGIDRCALLVVAPGCGAEEAPAIRRLAAMAGAVVLPASCEVALPGALRVEDSIAAIIAAVAGFTA